MFTCVNELVSNTPCDAPIPRCTLLDKFEETPFIWHELFVGAVRDQLDDGLKLGTALTLVGAALRAGLQPYLRKCRFKRNEGAV